MTFPNWAYVPFTAFVALVVRRRLMSAVKAARCQKHRPLWQSRFGDLEPGGVRTLGELLPAPSVWDPVERVEERDELRRLVDHLATALSPAEATILGRYLGGASLTECGEGLGRNPAKIADNALQRVRAKARGMAAAA